ncbi:MAG: GNAT family N-acetyltransferase [Hyphomicrobium sp.]
MTTASTFFTSGHFAMHDPVVSISAPVRDATLGVTFDIITDRASFDALETEWNDLFDRAGRSTQVFQTFNWNWHWANHYLGSSPNGIPGVELSVITGRRDGRLIMVWPLVKERVRGITQIFWMGEPVSQYGDVVIDSIPDSLDVMRAAWQHLSRNARADVMRLRRVRADATVAPLMSEINAHLTATALAPFLDLGSAPDFQTYEQRYTPHSRRNRRRLARRLEEKGAMVFERHKGGAEAGRLAVEALALKNRWLEDRGLISHAVSDPRMARFFADAAEGATRSTNCVVAALTSNGEPAALEVSFTCKGRLAMHVIVFNLKYEKAGAGVILLEQSLRDGFADGLDTYDMLAPGDSYKLTWSDATVEVQDWSVPLSIAGRAYGRIYLGLLRPRMKAMISAMPQVVRRVVSAGYTLIATSSVIDTI